MPQRATIIGSEESSFRYLDEDTASKDKTSNKRNDFELFKVNFQ